MEKHVVRHNREQTQIDDHTQSKKKRRDIKYKVIVKMALHLQIKFRKKNLRKKSHFADRCNPIN